MSLKVGGIVATEAQIQELRTILGISVSLAGYWHDRPRAEDVPVGTIYMATDWNNSLWASDGDAHWKPFGGSQIVKVLTPRNFTSRGVRFDNYPTEIDETCYAVGMVLDDFECEIVMRHRAFWTREPTTEGFRFYDALDLRANDEASGIIAPMVIYATATADTLVATNIITKPLLFVDTAVLKGVGPGAILTQSTFTRRTMQNALWGDLTVALSTEVVRTNGWGNFANRRLVAPNMIYRQVIDNSGVYANSLQMAQRIMDSCVITVRQG